MDLNTQKEQFSNAFIVAVAAAAGFTTGQWDVDDDSIDWQIVAAGGRGVSLRGLEPSENESSKTVKVPIAQRFDVDELREIMGRVRARELP